MNVVRKVMGHEQTPDDYEQRVIAALNGGGAFVLPTEDSARDEGGEDDDPDGPGAASMLMHGREPE